MRGRARLLEFFDRQVVDADDLDAVLDEMSRARLGHADVVRVELGRAPQPRVVRLDQQPDVFGRDRGRARSSAAMPLRDVTSMTRARPSSSSSGSASVPGAVVEEMPRRVDVGARCARSCAASRRSSCRRARSA